MTENINGVLKGEGVWVEGVVRVLVDGNLYGTLGGDIWFLDTDFKPMG